MFFTVLVATRIEQVNLTITFVTLFIQQRCIQSEQSAFNHSVLGPLLVDPFISEVVIFINFLFEGRGEFKSCVCHEWNELAYHPSITPPACGRLWFSHGSFSRHWHTDIMSLYTNYLPVLNCQLRLAWEWRHRNVGDQLSAQKRLLILCVGTREKFSRTHFQPVDLYSVK